MKKYYVLGKTNFFEYTEEDLYHNILRIYFKEVGESLKNVSYFSDALISFDINIKCNYVIYSEKSILTENELNSIKEKWDNIYYKRLVQKRIDKRYKNVIFRKDPVPGTGKCRWSSMFRNPKTTQERRLSFSCDEKYVRSRRNFTNLPEAWDDIYKLNYCDKTWKNKKKKRQWM